MSEIEKLTKAIKEQGEQIKEIHTVIAGNPRYGQKGIKDILDDHSKRIDKLEKNALWKTIKTAGTGAAIGGAIGTLTPKTVLSKFISFFT